MKALVIAFFILFGLSAWSYKAADSASSDDFGSGALVWISVALVILDVLAMLCVLIWRAL